MSFEHKDSYQTLPITPFCSFGPPDMFAIDTAISAEQPVMTNQVHNLVMTNPNINGTNHSIVNTSTNQGAGGHPFIRGGCGSDWRVILVAVEVQPKQNIGQSCLLYIRN